MTEIRIFTCLVEFSYNLLCPNIKVSFAGELFSPFHEKESNEMVYKGIVYGVNKSSSLQGKI